MATKALQLRPARRLTIGRVAMWATLLITTLISLWPMYWLFMTALTPTQETVKIPPDLLPINASTVNFQRLFVQASDYWRWGATAYSWPSA